MKKRISILFLMGFLITSCGSLLPFSDSKKYPTTTFFVKNNATETIHFNTTVVVFPMSRGPLTRSFSVAPTDSILVRRIGFKKDASPQKWFLEFKIFPNDKVKLRDPHKAKNWVLGQTADGKPSYTFLIAN